MNVPLLPVLKLPSFMRSLKNAVTATVGLTPSWFGTGTTATVGTPSGTPVVGGKCPVRQPMFPTVTCNWMF